MNVMCTIRLSSFDIIRLKAFFGVMFSFAYGLGFSQ